MSKRFETRIRPGFSSAKKIFSKIFAEIKNGCIFAKQNNNAMTQSINIKSVEQMSIEQIKTLIDQLESAMMTQMTFDKKIKLNTLIGKCITIYMSKKGL